MSFAVTRVSSQTTRSTVERTSSARNVKSRKFPIGVGTRYKPGFKEIGCGDLASFCVLSELIARNRFYNQRREYQEHVNISPLLCLYPLIPDARPSGRM